MIDQQLEQKRANVIIIFGGDTINIFGGGGDIMYNLFALGKQGRKVFYLL